MYNVAFDALYWAFGVVMLVAFLATITRSVAELRRGGDPSRSEATLVVAIGALVALVTGFGLNALRSVTGDLAYQQVHFGVFYVAFGLVLWGFDRVGMTGTRATRAGSAVRAIVWGVFGLSVVVAALVLLSPDRYRVVSGGDVRYVQETVFFVPVFVALAVGVAWLPSWLSPVERHSARPWLAAVAALLVVGLLREATIVPSTDQPIIDLALAFVPFTLASLCLYRAATVELGRAPMGPDPAPAI